MPDTSAELSDEELLYLVGTTDAELFAAGVDIKRRSFEVPRQVMHKLGYVGFIFAGAGTPSIYDRIYRAFSSIYRPQDLAVGGHIGVFMYRDIFARIAVPHVYGEVSINPFKFVELTPVQLRIIQTEPDQMEIFLDQFGDVADIQYGIDELNEPYASNELVRRFIGLARLHLHSASAVLTGGYDFRGAVQASLLAVELGLKAGAAAHGMPEDEIRQKFGHRVGDIAGHLARLWSSFDANRVARVVSAQPQYVVNRYSASQPPRQDVGHLTMGAQYVVSEVVRQMSDRNFRTSMSDPFERRYPA
ncbi:hypothetical protein [Devosia sp. XK-2]|uniref:hypothetical protein n=1 Tax=Devosia sp. XK-2 TaxID=3126689 RepID=UPI0030D5DA65